MVSLPRCNQSKVLQLTRSKYSSTTVTHNFPVYATHHFLVYCLLRERAGRRYNDLTIRMIRRMYIQTRGGNLVTN